MNDKLKFAKALRKPDPEAVKRITEHFKSQSDIFTQCPACGEKLSGTYEQVTSHQCLDSLIGA